MFRNNREANKPSAATVIDIIKEAVDNKEITLTQEQRVYVEQMLLRFILQTFSDGSWIEYAQQALTENANDIVVSNKTGLIEIKREMGIENNPATAGFADAVRAFITKLFTAFIDAYYRNRFLYDTHGHKQAFAPSTGKSDSYRAEPEEYLEFPY